MTPRAHPGSNPDFLSSSLRGAPRAPARAQASGYVAEGH
jgi:hypothetical protein